MKCTIANRDVLNDRMAYAIELRELHKLRWKEIGEKLGGVRKAGPITALRAKEIYARAKRLQSTAAQIRSSPWRGLSTRVSMKLSNFTNMRTRQDLLNRVKKGDFIPGKSTVRNVGRKSCVEIYRFLGLQLPQESVRVKLCPHCGKNIYQPAIHA